jgi:hypothetical protein
MDYAHDMPPYVQEIVEWLDDPARVHPCNGENAYKGFEIAMAICRPAAVNPNSTHLPAPFPTRPAVPNPDAS